MTERKTKTVLVKCMVVDSDGFPVDGHGNTTRKPWYEWDKRRRPMKWLNDPSNRKLWKEVKR